MAPFFSLSLSLCVFEIIIGDTNTTVRQQQRYSVIIDIYRYPSIVPLSSPVSHYAIFMHGWITRLPILYLSAARFMRHHRRI